MRATRQISTRKFAGEVDTHFIERFFKHNFLGQILEQSAILEGQTKMALNGMRADYTQQRDLLLTSINALM